MILGRFQTRYAQARASHFCGAAVASSDREVKDSDIENYLYLK